MRARRGQELGLVRKWLHSNALADPGSGARTYASFWTIPDPPLWRAAGDLTVKSSDKFGNGCTPMHCSEWAAIQNLDVLANSYFI